MLQRSIFNVASMIAIVGAFIILSAPSPAQQQPAGQAKPNQPAEPPIPAVIEPAEVDFGVCRPKEKKPAEFTIVNKGSAPLTISEVTPSCKCTDLENISGKVIQPGERLSFKASMAMPPAPGGKDAKVFVRFKGWSQKVLIGKMKAVVKMAIEASPDHLDAVAKPDRPVAPTSGTLTVTSRDGKPFRILSAGGEKPRFIGFNPDSDSPRTTYQLAWDLSRWPCEGMKLWWIIETDHPECRALPVEIWHDCVGSKADPDRMSRGWMVHERLEHLGDVRAGKAIEVEIETSKVRKDKQVSPVTEVVSLTKGLSARLVSYRAIDEGTGAAKIELIPSPDFSGLLYAVLEFKSTKGSAKLTVVGTVLKSESEPADAKSE